MSRFTLTRYSISGTLVAESPLAIGSLKGELVDMPLQRDGSGQPIIPGTALAGAMRAQMARDTGWGSILSASDIAVEDARWVGSDGDETPAVDVRQGVSINRYTGTAESEFLYDFEVIATGSRFALAMSIDADDPTLVQEVVDLLAAGISVGRSTSTGLGQIRLTDHEVHLRRRNSREDLIKHILNQPATSLEIVPAPESSRRVVALTVPWQAKGPVLVADDALGDAVDIVPKVMRDIAADPATVRLLIPGSSLKGVLRAHAESILRTVLGAPSLNRPDGGEWPAKRKDAHKSDLQALAGMQLIADLFGTPGDNKVPVQKAALLVHDCTSTASWAQTKWSAVVGSGKDDSIADGLPQGQLLEALCHLDGPCSDKCGDACDHLQVGRFVIGDHVAIDRWTGGAADGALYSVLEPWLLEKGDWTPVRLEIDLRRIDPDSTRGAAALYLLLLTLRDFADGWITLGFGAAKGYGHVVADPVDETTLAQASAEPDTWLATARTAWVDWVNENGSGAQG